MTNPRCHHLVWVVLVLCLWKEGVDASHKVFRDLQSVQPSIVSEQYRTAYHFQPPKNWINDPNGPMLYDGIYHLFYQYNPKGAVWGNIIWAHAVSTDLVNWNILGPAIYPTKPFDINGCWSGSATILPGGHPAILYTGIDQRNRQVQNIAFPKNLSDPYLREWYKPDYNPVIPPVDGINASAFRDPTTGWLGADGQWRVVVGSKRGLTGKAILYRSNDFVHWAKARHPLHSVATSGMWECPDFFPVPLVGRHGLDTSVNSGGVKHVLKVSLDLTRYEYYTLGRYMAGVDRYVPDATSNDDRTGLRYDYGNYYASKSFYDAGKRRRVLLGWANESDSVADDVAKGWAGIHLIPRTIWLDEKGRQLVQWPVEEIEALRGKKVQLQDIAVKKGSHVQVKGINTSQADVEVDFEVSGLEKAERFDPRWLVDPQKLCTQKGASVPGGVGPFGLLVLASGNLTEYTAVFFRVFKSPTRYFTLMCSDASRSSVRPEVYKPAFGGFVDVNLRKKGKVSLRSLIDHSVVESFGAGGRTCITSRVYPSFLSTGPRARLYAFNHGSQDVRISKLRAWEMANAKIHQVES